MAPATSSPTCTDCRNVFPILQSAFVDGPIQCPKCQQLEAHKPGSDQHRKIMEFPQCVVCGDSWRNMPLPGDNGVQTCGRDVCVEQVASALASEGSGKNPGANPTRPAAPAPSNPQQQRNTLLYDKLKSGTASNSNNKPPFNSAALDQRLTQLRTLASADRKNFITVVLEIRFTKGANANRSSVDDRYGASKRAFPPTATLIDVQDWGVEQFNSVHTKAKGNQPIEASETSLRLMPNEPIHGSTMLLQLKQYKNNLIEEGVLDDAGCWIQKKGKGTVGKAAIHFELFIFFEMYEKRMDLLAEAAGSGTTELSSSKPTTGSGTGGKRHERTGSAAATESGSKRPRNAGASAIQSEFALSNRRTSYASAPSTRVKLQKIACPLVTAQGQPVFEKKEMFYGYIASKSFASGLTKCAFELLVPNSDQEFVVKRFYVNLTHDGGDSLSNDTNNSKIPPAPFTAEEHNVQIEAECVSLHLGARFLAEFFKFCKSKNVQVFENLRFEDAFLLQEIEGPASPASGMPQHDEVWGFDGLAGLMWLAEKKHATSRVVRFNGTLAHPSAHTDLAHLTVYAFIHYIFGHTNQKLVFADVQGTPALFELENGKTADGFTLFDPMIHSMTGNFGVGDHGKAGISKFLEQHECRDICRLLGLHDAVPLALAEDSGVVGNRAPKPTGSRHSSGLFIDYSSSGSESEGDGVSIDIHPFKSKSTGSGDDGEQGN